MMLSSFNKIGEIRNPSKQTGIEVLPHTPYSMEHDALQFQYEWRNQKSFETNRHRVLPRTLENPDSLTKSFKRTKNNINKIKARHYLYLSQRNFPYQPGMDTFFISHGSPTLVIDDSIPARPFLQSWRSSIMQETPKAILIVSGHWDTDAPTMNQVHGANDTIYDFYGFPSKMYQLKYPAPGAPDLAQKVTGLLNKAGFGPVKEDKTRGLDHGAWVPLKLMYPEANIPVCQLSVQARKGAEYHYNMGKALSPLREEGVLIIGSGNATHNLRVIGPAGGPVAKWASDFDTWLKEAVIDGRYEDLNNYEAKAPSARMSHPWPDHLFPLHVALGAAGEGAKGELIHHSWICTFSYASYRFTSAK